LLDLSHNSIGDEGARALADADADAFGSLTRLQLYFNGIGNEGASALAASATLRRCQVWR
jgi:hypothetical protein